MARPTKLKYIGRTEPIFDEKGKQTGERPVDFHNGVPARDLKEEDVALLSDDDIKLALSGPNPIYVDPEAEKAKRERERAKVAKQNAENVMARDRKSAKKASPPSSPEPDPSQQEAPAVGGFAWAQEQAKADGTSGEV